MSSTDQYNRAYPPNSALGSVTAKDGWELRVFNWPQTDRPARGSILFQAGRGDLFEKYLEALTHWHAQGWDITSFDWRGQGGSGRLSKNRHVGHVDDFSIWIDDLDDFYAHWQAASPGPHIIMGHSMGGHLVLRALVEGRIKPDAAILSAPMLGLKTPGIVRWLTRQLAKIIPSHWPAWPGNEKPSLPMASRQKMLTHDAKRYADELWWHAQKPELKLGPGSWQWLAAAFRSFDIIDAKGAMEAINCPVLLMGTAGDALVDPEAIRKAHARIAGSELVMFARSVAHEFLREVDAPRDYAIAKIDAFMGGALKQ